MKLSVPKGNVLKFLYQVLDKLCIQAKQVALRTNEAIAEAPTLAGSQNLRA